MTSSSPPASGNAGYRFLWERVWRSAHGPVDERVQHGSKTFSARAATLCNVLGALAMYMSEDGSRCRPTIDALVTGTKLGRDTVCMYLAWGERLGWFTRRYWEERRPTGSVERVTYDPQIPHAALDAYLAEQAELSGQVEIPLPPDPAPGADARRSDSPTLPREARSDSPTAAGGHGRIVREARSDSPEGTVGQSYPINQLSNKNQPSEEEGPAPGDDDVQPPMMIDPEKREAAVAAMWAYLDGHPLREMFGGEVAWRTFRYGQTRLIQGELPRQWWVDRLDAAVNSWDTRAELFCRAVDMYAADLTRPGRLPAERVYGIDHWLIRWVIPQTFDPFSQVVSGRPRDGTEHAAVSETVRQDQRSSGDQRVRQAHDGSGLTSLDVVLPVSGWPPAVIEGWAAEHPEQADAADTAALRSIGLDPIAVATGKVERPTRGAAAAQYRGARTTYLLDAMRAVGFTAEGYAAVPAPDRKEVTRA